MNILPVVVHYATSIPTVLIVGPPQPTIDWYTVVHFGTTLQEVDTSSTSQDISEYLSFAIRRVHAAYMKAPLQLLLKPSPSAPCRHTWRNTLSTAP